MKSTGCIFGKRNDFGKNGFELLTCRRHGLDVLSRLGVVELVGSIPRLWFYRVVQLGAYRSPRLVPRNCRPFDSRWERLVVVVLHYRLDFGDILKLFCVRACEISQPKEN